MKVIFYQPVSFLRSAKKTNPFFDPVIDVCRKNGIDWELWLPDARVEHGYEKTHVRGMRAFYFWYHAFYRLFHYGFRIDGTRAQVWSGFVLRQLTFHRHKADLVISIAGCLVHAMKSFFPHTRAADIQHGVVYSSHKGYFDPQGRIWPCYWSYPEREFWLYGPGYANCFFKNPENHRWLDGRVKVIGDVVRAGKDAVPADAPFAGSRSRNVVVFSAQFTPDLDDQEIKMAMEAMKSFFSAFYARFQDRYVCYIKHHPRFGNVCDLGKFYKQFPQIAETNKSWPELYGEMALHVTFTSTVAFDCASAGVPTCLISLPDAKIINCSYYKSDYDYPYYGMSAEQILSIPFADSSKAVHEWYRRFYAPFSADACAALLI